MADTEELERLAAGITPGPWVSSVEDNGDFFKVKSGEVWVVGGCGCCESPWTDENCAQSNARAIALLPELLAELIATRRASGTTTTNQNYDDPVSSRQATSEKCPECGDTGLRDSGGVHPWGEHISVPCDCQATSESAEPMMTDEEISEFIAEYGQPSDTFSYLTPPQPMTVEAAAKVLLDKWLHGEFEDDADAIAQDQLDYGGDASSVVEAWLRAALQRKEGDE